MTELKKTEERLKAFLSSIVPCTTVDDFRVDESFLQFPKDLATKENVTMIANIVSTLSTPIGYSLIGLAATNVVFLVLIGFLMFQNDKKTTPNEDPQQIEMGEWAQAEIVEPAVDQEEEDWSEENQAAYEENQAPIASEDSTWSLP
jgi:hypothetical protein